MVRRIGGRKAARRRRASEGTCVVTCVVQRLETRVLFSGSADYVIHVSVDGLRPDAVTQLGEARLPNFHRLRAEGAFTDNARTDYDYTITLPNHATQLTGRYVAGAAGHNWVTNTDPAAGETLHSNKGAYVASAWDVAHDAGLRTGLYSSKTKFSLFDESYDDDTASTADPLQGGARDADPAGGDNGRDKIDRTVVNTDSVAMTGAFVADLAAPDRSRYALVHYHDPDTAGHANGWMGTSYFAALELVDAQLGRIFSAVDGNTALAGKTAIVLTADHGGEGAGHGDAADAEAYTIPFYVWGPGVTAGGDLYRMNQGTRSDPGTGRPDNTAAPQPIRDGDVANLAMDFLGLPSVPGSFFNAAQDLQVDVYSPPPQNEIFTFQQGAGGYAGAVDTDLRENAPTAANGAAASLKVDSDDPANTQRDAQALLRFDDLFGTGPGQVRPDGQIRSARLELQVTNGGDAVRFHRMVRAWGGADTWNSLGAGVQADGVEALAAADVTTGLVPAGLVSLDVTASLRAWQANPASNRGWAVLPTGPDGVDFNSSEGAIRPRLVVDVARPNAAPVAAGDEFVAAEDTPLVVPTAGGVLQNDSDADGDPLAAVVVDGPAHGTLSLAPDGAFTFTPAADFHGADSFTYKAGDGRADSAPATVAITVAGSDDPPTAADDAYVMGGGDTSITVAAPGVLANDRDADGDALTAEVVQPPAHGELALNPDGSFNYAAGGTFSGTDTFTYSVFDGTTWVTATVVLGRNQRPTARADAYATAEDAALSVAGPGVLANDSDPNAGDRLTARLVTGVPAGSGTLTLRADGSFVFAPAANFSGTVSFSYEAVDALGEASPAPGTVEIVVNPVNDAPAAEDDAAAATEDTALVIAPLANDADVERDALAVTGWTPPANGELAFNGDGTFTYRPGVNFNGPDSFTYTVADGNGGSATATVTIQVAPVADPTVRLAATTPTASEPTGTSPAAPGVFTVTRDGDLSVPLEVRYAASGNATAGADYEALTGIVTIPAGDASATFSVRPLHDLLVEPDETVVVTLASSRSYDVAAGVGAATVTVLSDDVSAPAAPTNLQAPGSKITRTSAELTWFDRSTNEQRFVIEISSDGKTWTRAGEVAANATRFNVTGLAANRLYYFRVYAANAGGSSGYSNVLQVRTKR